MYLIKSDTYLFHKNNPPQIVPDFLFEYKIKYNAFLQIFLKFMMLNLPNKWF